MNCIAFIEQRALLEVDLKVIKIDEMTANGISKGINKYAEQSGMKIKAVAFPFALTKKNRKKLKKLIRNQIETGNPVILSVGSKWPDSESVKKANKAKMYAPQSESTLISFEKREDMYNHYVVITGVLVNRQENSLKYQISSWGNKYFIDYDDMCRYIDNYGSDWTSSAVFVYNN